MTRGENEFVYDAEGVRGTLEAPVNDAETGGRARVLLADGRRLWLPPDALERQAHGTLVFRGSFEELTKAAVVPVVEEGLSVGRRVVETGRVRVTKTVREREEVVDMPLLREEYDVERVPIDEFVDGPVAPRHEGETLVVPVLEEVLVVEKRLVVREELRITRRRTVGRETRRVGLLSEEVSVERRPVNRPVSEGDLSAFREGTFELRERSEEAVVDKTARVVEEVAINKEVGERTETVRDTVRKTDVDVEETRGTKVRRATAAGRADDIDIDRRDI